jgi:hypothetical protein
VTLRGWGVRFLTAAELAAATANDTTEAQRHRE